MIKGLWDSSVCQKPDVLLRSFINIYRYALVVFDCHGCGRELSMSPEQIETGVQDVLSRNGWRDRSEVIAINPEIENWVWSSSNHVCNILGWEDTYDSMKSLLVARGFWSIGKEKPSDPKGALEFLLRRTNVQMSSSLFSELAEKVSFSRCNDRAFCKLRDTLRRWFPIS